LIVDALLHYLRKIDVVDYFFNGVRIERYPIHRVSNPKDAKRYEQNETQ
jgi:hypothetical protein